MTRALSEQEIVRRESLQKLRDLGIDPYPAHMFGVDHTSKKIIENYKEGEEQNVIIAGRLMSRRIMGKASFAELQDSVGKIQIYVNRDEICKGEDKTMYNIIFKKLLDIGDIIGLTGTVFISFVFDFRLALLPISIACCNWLVKLSIYSFIFIIIIRFRKCVKRSRKYEIIG